MGWKDAPLADDRDALAKQFRALRTLAASFEARLGHYEKQRHVEHRAQADLEGERATNELLTQRVEALEAAIDAVIVYDWSDCDSDVQDAMAALSRVRNS